MLLGIEIDNFRCFDHLRLDFDGQPGLVAVTGKNDVSDYSDSNGVGKTSLWMAQVWGLFGKFPGMSSPNAVIRNTGKRGTQASVKQWLRLRDGRKFFVQRTRAKGKSTVVMGFDDEVAKGWDEKEANEQIEQTIGVSYERYTQLMLFTGSFVFASETDKGQKDILDSLVQLDLGALQERVKATWAHCDKECSMREVEREAAEKQLATLAADLENQASLAESWAQVRESEASSVRGALQAEMQARAQAAQDAASWAAWVEELQRVEDHRQALRRATETVSWTTEQLADVQQRVTELESQLVVLESDNFHCPSCKQPLSGDQLAQAQATARTSRGLAEDRLKKLHVQRLDLEAKQTQAVASQQQLEAQVAAIARAQVSLQDARAGVQAAQAAVSKADQEIARWQERLRGLEAAESPYAAAVAALQAQQQETSARLEQIKTTEAAWLQSLRLYAYLLGMLDRKGLPHFALEMLLPGLTQRASIYLAKMSPTQMRVAFQSKNDRGTEKFHIIAASETGAEFYSDLSAGERQRINLAIFLALHDIASETLHSPGVVWIDEVLDVHTDESGKLAMLELLADYAVDRQLSVWIITNDRTVSSERRYLRGIVTLEKTPDGVRAA